MMDPDREAFLAAVSGFGEFDGFFSSIKKAAKKVGGAAKTVTRPVARVAKKAAKTTVGKVLLAPVVAPVALQTKAATWALGKTGVKPLKKLDSAANKAYKSKTVSGLRKTYGVELATGAAIGATILTGGGAAAVTAAALPGGLALVTGKAGKMSLKETVKVGLTGAAAGVGTSVIGQSFLPDEKVRLPSAQPSAQAASVDVVEAASTAPDIVAAAATSEAAPSRGGGLMGPLAGAGAGLLLAGPIGAVAGLAAGLFLGRKKG
jgi:hypothetical protein